MIKLENLSFSYDGINKVLEDINIEFHSKEVVAIQGTSGVGKSTLLAILAGQENNYQGNLIFNEQIIDHSKLFDYCKDNVSIIFQDLNLINYLNIKDNIVQSSLIRNKGYDENRIVDYIKLLNLNDISLTNYPSKLSGGQQQRIAIIRALLCDTKIILADEPTANIDKDNAKIIINQLKKLACEEDKIIIIVTHDDNIAQVCNHKYVLKDKHLSIN